MEEVVFLLSLIVVVVLIIILSVYNSKMNSKVIDLSSKIKALDELNKEIIFYEVNEYIDIYQHYDNKWQYNKIQPAYLMSAHLRDNIQSYALYIQQVQQNRKNKVIYDNRVKKILSTKNDIDFEAAGISEKAFERREKKLFNRKIVPQYTDCTVYVRMSYSSPKGKVQLSKSDEFNFDELFTSFNSISRSKLDYKTYRALAAVERGNVSDSLRYDIMHRDGFRCTLCGASAREGVTLHVDHIVPIAKGGKSTPSNLRTLCERCNVGKSDKME